MDGREAEREAPRKDLAFTALCALLGLLPRLYVAIAWSREAVWDGQYYHLGARRIAAGFGYSDELLVNGVPTWHAWCHYPVGYSALLGGVYRVFGDGSRVAPVTNAVIGALLCAVVHRLARHAMTPERARIAGLLAAFVPGLVVYAPLVMTEPVAALGTLLAAWLMARDAARHPWRGALLAGLVVGLSTLVRPPSWRVRRRWRSSPRRRRRTGRGSSAGCPRPPSRSLRRRWSSPRGRRATVG
ncbi:MAG: glycosyltransferase family 39 protein [Polyangiaceae bacterium]